MKLQARQQAFGAALIYVIVASNWIIFSNGLLKRFAGNLSEGPFLDTIKDCSFVVLTGGLLHLMMRRLFRRWEEEIEQRKSVEKNLRRTERALKTLSSGNAVLVRAASESMLLSEICRVIVDKGGYRMAWVGIAEDDTQKTVRIAARAGHDEGYLDGAKITWSDTNELGRGPTGIAIRTGQIVVCNDFHTDPKTAPWRQKASKHGYASNIVLPLRVAGKSIEVLTIYAAEPHAFNATEVELLKELADDLAYGIQTLRTRLEHERAEETVRESENKFSKTFHSSPVPVSLSTIEDGRFLDANEEFLKLFQRSRAEVVGHTSFELELWVDPEHRALIAAEIKAKGTARNVEVEMRDKSGHIHNILLSVEEVVIGGERCWLVSAQDITERKRAEETLRKSEAFVRTVLDSLTAHIAVLDESGTIVAINQAWRRFAEENGGDGKRLLVGANYLTICQPGMDLPANQSVAVAFQGITAVKSGKQPSFHLEYPCHSPAAQRWFSMHVWPLAGSDKGVVVAHENITERKLAEEQVHLQLSALNATANAIVITDRCGKIEWVNPAFINLTGYGAAEVIGANPRLLKSGQHPPGFYTKLWATIQTGNVWHGELTNKRKDGTLYTEATTITPVRGTDGRIAHFVAIKQDVTERQSLESQLRQSQKMEAIGQLAGGVAHDFNNILAALLMQTEFIRMVEELPKEVADGLDQIRADTKRAAELTRQLLLFSRRQVMQSRNLDVNEVVTNLTKLLQRIIGEDVSLQLNLHPTPLITHADAGMIEQVLMNLAVNARDAMPKGGRLRIETSDKIVTKDSAGLHPDASPGRYVCFSVSDTGTGISPDVLPKIFEPFFTTKDAGKGTGLGLATVFGIVKQHQGWIKVDNQPGAGVTFRIFLPASTVVATETAKKGEKPKPLGGNETILLVEDEAGVRKLTGTLLERYGYNVMAAANGPEALDLCRAEGRKVALLLTDLVMPGGMSGQELARKMQVAEPNLKIIFISGYSAEIAGRELQLRNGENFIQKPFAVDHLLGIVRRSLDG